MQIIAHRGASFDAPENTLAAVQLAWRQRADAVEVDVHRSRDGQLVVIHDPNARRTAALNRKVASLTLAQLRQLDAGIWKGPAWRGEKIPTLEEVLATVPEPGRLFIEIKCGVAAAPELARVLDGSRCRPDQIVLIGFSRQTMARLKRRFPKIETAWVTVLKPPWRSRKTPHPAALIKKAQAAGLNALDLAAAPWMDAAFVDAIHQAGLKLYVWTVDSPATARKLAQAGVDGLTTNRPGWLRMRL